MMGGVCSIRFGRIGELTVSYLFVLLHFSTGGDGAYFFCFEARVADIRVIRIMFCITTRTFRAKEMGDQILQAADDIKALLLIQQQTINNTDAHLNGQNGLN